MKKRLASLVLALSLCFSLAACGASSSGSSTSGATGSTSTGSRTSIVRMTADNTPKIDPAVGADFSASQTQYNLYEPLIYWDRTPCLAESYEVSDDELTYTFHLHQGVTFHDGSELKASDVVYSFNRLMTVGEGNAYLFSNVTNTEATDDYTVVMTLGNPEGPFLDKLYKFYIVSESIVTANTIDDGTYGENGDYGKGFMLTNDAGTGPYMATEMVQQDYFLASRYEGWWQGWAGRENAPEQFKVIYCTEATTQYTMFANQECEISSCWYTPENYESLDSLGGVDLANDFAGVEQYIFFNCSKEPTDDVNYRKAICCLLDYQSFIGPVFGGDSQTPSGPVPAAVSGHVDCTQYEYNQEKALEYLAQSKYADTYQDIDLTFFLHDAGAALEKMVLSLQASCAQIGINVVIEKGTWLGLQENMSTAEGADNTYTCNVSTPCNDAAAMLNTLYSSATQGTYENPCWIPNDLTAKLDVKLADAVQTPDTDERYAKAADLQNYINDDICPAAFVGDLSFTFAYQSAYLDWPMASNYSSTGKGSFYPMGTEFFVADMSIIG